MRTVKSDFYRGSFRALKFNHHSYNCKTNEADERPLESPSTREIVRFKYKSINT